MKKSLTSSYRLGNIASTQSIPWRQSPASHHWAKRSFFVSGLHIKPECLHAARHGGGLHGSREYTQAFFVAPKLRTSVEIYMLKVLQIGRPARKIQLCSPQAVYDLMKPLQYADREQMFVLHLDTGKYLIGKELVAVGKLDAAIIHPREVFKAAIVNNSHSIICVHNHPTGDPTPSKDDRDITSRLRSAGDILGIPLVDHVIIGAGKYVSIF